MPRKSKSAPAARRVVVFINQKGGVAKTTSTLHLSHALALASETVTAVDMDPVQRSLMSYASNVTAFNIVQATAENLDAVLDGLSGYVVLDCNPGLTPATAAALKAADLVLIPVVPDAKEMEATGKFLGTVHAARTAVNPGLNAALVATRVKNTATHGAAVLAIRHMAEWPLLGVIAERPEFAKAAGRVQTVFDLAPDSAGAVQYAALAEAVRAHFKEVSDGG